MEDGAPYFVDVDVPTGVLLGDSRADAQSQRHPSDCGAVWYKAQADAITFAETQSIHDWTPEMGMGVVAFPVKPNTMGAKLHPSGGIAFEEAINTGLVAEAALSETQEFTCAVRFTSPGGEARTLVTINPNDCDNYLFLNEKNGVLHWQDQQGTVEVRCPAPGHAMWVVVGYRDGRLNMVAASEGQAFGAPISSDVQSHTLDGDLAGSSDLFIGCRSHRKGILKTLGQSQIKDVLFWADTLCLTPEGMDDLTAACRYVEAEGMAS